MLHKSHRIPKPPDLNLFKFWWVSLRLKTQHAGRSGEILYWGSMDLHSLHYLITSSITYIYIKRERGQTMWSDYPALKYMQSLDSYFCPVQGMRGLLENQPQSWSERRSEAPPAGGHCELKIAFSDLHSPRRCCRTRPPVWGGNWTEPPGEWPRCSASLDSTGYPRSGSKSAGSRCIQCRGQDRPGWPAQLTGSHTAQRCLCMLF